MSSNTHVVCPRDGHQHTHTVIFLHGRDSDCDEFASDFFESEATEPAGKSRTLLDLFPSIKWVFPRAPLLHSERFDTTMSQWFDMWSVEHPEERVEIQEDGLKKSIRSLVGIIKDEEQLVSREKIFLGGISQGFASAVSAFLVGEQGFAGLVGLCSWMPSTSLSSIDEPVSADNISAVLRSMSSGQDSTESTLSSSVRGTPVFLSHSTDDDVVPIQNGKKLRDTLRSVLDSGVEWHEYESGGHWINEPQGVDDIVGFLKANMV